MKQLVGLQPGVAYTGADQIYIGNSSPNGATNVVNFSVNGARTSGNAWTVDGADNVDRGSNFTLLTYPSVDAIAEFKTLMMRGAYSAEFGRSASGQINVVTKSGTSSFHGSAYEFVRNDVFNANDVLNKLSTNPNGTTKATANRGALRYNDFGYTIGGPVWIPKIYDGRNHGTYFFFSQEIRRVTTYKPVTLLGVPTKLERQGIFTKPVCASHKRGGQVQQYRNDDANDDYKHDGAGLSEGHLFHRRRSGQYGNTGDDTAPQPLQRQPADCAC